MNRRKLMKTFGINTLVAIIGSVFWFKKKKSVNPYYAGPVTDHFDGRVFFNPNGISHSNFLNVMKWQMFEEKSKWPETYDSVHTDTVPAKAVNGTAVEVTLIGHATFLIQLNGQNLLTDPVFSQRVSPVSFAGPKRVNPPGVRIENLPEIDVILLSHNHYDHLDMKTVKHLAEKGSKFFVGLGVGAHLEKWGIDKSSIKEMDWGDSVKFKDLVVNCTQARHYSGRKSMSRNTLWASWVVQGVKHSVFHSGDSGYSDHFKEIGERFKNIDMSFIKVGDYGLDLGWQDIHMLPENSVQAHVDLGAKQMIPIHWGVFTLSNHPWDEPIERTVKAATGKNIVLRTPKIGEVVETEKAFKESYWWRDLKSF